jgi:hypothetical protein
MDLDLELSLVRWKWGGSVAVLREPKPHLTIAPVIPQLSSFATGLPPQLLPPFQMQPMVPERNEIELPVKELNSPGAGNSGKESEPGRKS